MKLLLKGGSVVNVFTGEIEKNDVLIEDNKIIGVGNYSDADIIEDVTDKVLCPGFIDGHIHIESTMLTPSQLAKAVLPHGTTAIVADPHEIANVCGTKGIEYMRSASKNLPLNVYFMLPSCVPATPFDESGAILTAKELKPFYKCDDVLGLAEVMNFPGVIYGDEGVKAKLNDVKGVADGHAPMLSGKDLDTYVAAGITSDHECSNFDEAVEKLKKGQWIMIRQGTAAKNLSGLINLFDAPYSHRCLLVTDDRHPADILNEGHIDNIIRNAVKLGKSAITGIQMATIQAATYFGLKHVGAIAPGYRSDILILNDLDTVDIKDVYSSGKKVNIEDIKRPEIKKKLLKAVKSTFNYKNVTADNFKIESKSNKCRVIKTIPDQLLTEELICEIDFNKNNGIDLEKDILKIAVMERHNKTGHIGVGFVNGIGLKKGAIATSVSHDSHNLIVIGTNEKDMAYAANYIKEIGGGFVAVADGKVLASVQLEIAGLMTDADAKTVADRNEVLLETIYKEMGVPNEVSPLMIMAFLGLSVIPHLKMTTLGLIDVNKQQLVPLFV